MTIPTAATIDRLRRAGCVFAEEEAALLLEAADGDERELEALLRRRENGEPLEPLLGWVGFCGLRVLVEPGVFVPRRRTEGLVRTALTRRLRRGAIVVDLCCGTGAVGLAVATAVGDVALHAVDVDPAAVACARRNLAAVGGLVHEGDLDACLPGALAGRVDLLLANAPYVPSAAVALLPPEARLHEPRVALDGGADGVEVQRRVAALAPRWLAPEGRLLIETSERQASATAAAVTSAGLRARVVRRPSPGSTVVVGSRR